jgi:hypothetical protein
MAAYKKFGRRHRQAAPADSVDQLTGSVDRTMNEGRLGASLLLQIGTSIASNALVFPRRHSFEQMVEVRQ